jgi:hypothetical protein
MHRMNATVNRMKRELRVLKVTIALSTLLKSFRPIKMSLLKYVSMGTVVVIKMSDVVYHLYLHYHQHSSEFRCVVEKN